MSLLDVFGGRRSKVDAAGPFVLHTLARFVKTDVRVTRASVLEVVPAWRRPEDGIGATVLPISELGGRGWWHSAPRVHEPPGTGEMLVFWHPREHETAHVEFVLRADELEQDVISVAIDAMLAQDASNTARALASIACPHHRQIAEVVARAQASVRDAAERRVARSSGRRLHIAGHVAELLGAFGKVQP